MLASPHTSLHLSFHLSASVLDEKGSEVSRLSFPPSLWEGDKLISYSSDVLPGGPMACSSSRTLQSEEGIQVRSPPQAIPSLKVTKKAVLGSGGR